VTGLLILFVDVNWPSCCYACEEITSDEMAYFIDKVAILIVQLITNTTAA